MADCTTLNLLGKIGEATLLQNPIPSRLNAFFTVELAALERAE